MAKILLALGALLLIVGGGVFAQGPSENPWSFLAWGIPFAAGLGAVLFGLRRAGTRALRILNGLLLVPHLLFTAFFALVLVMRLA
jgi:hypothetical protein